MMGSEDKRRLRRAQRRLSRKAKGSANRLKQKRIVARLYEKTAAFRAKFFQQFTNKMTKGRQSVAVTPTPLRDPNPGCVSLALNADSDLTES